VLQFTLPTKTMYAIYMLKVVKDTEDNAYTTQNKYDMRV
jgi:hypothetical protein